MSNARPPARVTPKKQKPLPVDGKGLAENASGPLRMTHLIRTLAFAVAVAFFLGMRPVFFALVARFVVTIITALVLT